MEVKIACTGSGMMPLNQIIPLQGGLKDLSDANYRKLKNQILTHGMVSPFMIWEGRCIDGHQRLRTLLKMKEEGILMPESFPKVDIEAPDIKSAKRILLAISSQYGKLTGDGLYEYMQDMEIDIPEMKESFEFDSLDFGDFEKEYFDENPGTIEGEDDVPVDAPTISKLGDIWHLGAYYECEKCKKQFPASIDKMECDACLG